MQKESLRTVSHASTSLGIKAVVACSIKGREEFTHEVKLWNANSREDYADKCIKAMNGNLPPAKVEKARKHIDAWLRREEKRLKKIEEDKAHSATISDNGKPKRMTEQERE